MLQAIREILPLALGVAVSPIPMAAIIFVLMTNRGKTNGWAFLLGWILGLVLLTGGIAALLGSIWETGKDESGLTLPLIRIGFGVFMLGLAARSWSRRPRRGEIPDMPGWMKTLDQLNFPGSILLGMLLLALNLKNLPISISAGAVLVRYQTKPAEFAIALLVFTLVASIGVALPVLVAHLGGEKTDLVLQNRKRWLAAHNATILCGLFLVIGLTSLGKGLAAFF